MSSSRYGNHDSVTYGTDSLAEFGELNGDSSPINRSYNSGISNSSPVASASSSKAVLAALRALQDKIRRLESERAQAIDEAAQLRHQIKSQEIETEHLRQKESLVSQKNLHEVRDAYEKVLAEKMDTEIRLAKLEERNREEQRISEDLRVKIRLLEEEKHSGMLSIKDLEAEKTHLESQIQHIHLKDRDLGQTLVWENKRHEEDMDLLTNKLRSLQGELANVISEKSVVETKLIELDQLVGQLLSVNESLVVRLSGKTIPKGVSVSGIKKKSVVHKQNVYNQVPRVASVSTASFDASRKAGLAPMAAAARIIDEAENLQKMHRMYVNLAQSITSEPKRMKRPTSAPSNSMSYNKPTTMLKSKKMENQRMSDEFKSFDNGGGSNYIRIPSTQFENIHQSNNDDSFLRTSNSGMNYNNHDNHRQNELQDVITSLEEEFTQLKDDYRRLLASVQVNSPSIDTLQAEELVAVIQKLHKKGEQLRTLKSSPR